MKALLTLLRALIDTLIRRKFNPESKGYDLIFEEDWDDNIDWSKWSWREPWSGEQDTTKGLVTWKQDLVQLGDNGLMLIARRDGNRNRCGLISSHRFLEVLYGYVEVTAKMPPGGFTCFPAIWMYDKTGWTPECDIAELMGDNSRSITMTHHWAENGQHNSEGTTLNLPYDLSSGFHQFGLEWTPGKLAWFIDRKEVYSTENQVPQVPLFLICNIQCGGQEGAFNHLFTTDEVPAEMVIRKIEVWQK